MKATNPNCIGPGKPISGINGIEALYKCMKDPELELKICDGKWETFDEYMGDGDGPIWSCIMDDDWEVRKRQSNLDKAVEEAKEWFGRSRPGTLKGILSKYIKEETQ